MNPYVFIAIGIIIVWIVIFFVTYVLNKKTPVPEGCEAMKITDENCMACGNTECRIKKDMDFKKIEEQIKEEK